MPVNRISRFGLVNVYLVEEEDGLTVIDTALPGSTKAILAAAAKFSGKPITTILLTHAHGDHIGSLDKLHAAVPEAAVVISARDARLLVKDKTLDPDEPQVNEPPLPAGHLRDLAQADRDGERQVPARPRPGATGAGPRQGGRVPGRGDGRGDQARRMRTAAESPITRCASSLMGRKALI
jgi:glyoxylase-like metal-dependent hydrolase (beta-lactamase superfamily II)